jgi:ABC-type Fe3+/spermidine/putrescine transport system ATPase subunit
VDLGDGQVIRIPVDSQRRAGEQVHVGVRPEKISVNPRDAQIDAGENVVEATLTSSVFVGVSYQYFFETRQGRHLSAFDRNAGRGPVASAGDAVCLAWRPEHTFVIAGPVEGDEAVDQAFATGGAS